MKACVSLLLAGLPWSGRINFANRALVRMSERTSECSLLLVSGRLFPPSLSHMPPELTSDLLREVVPERALLLASCFRGSVV